MWALGMHIPLALQTLSLAGAVVAAGQVPDRGSRTRALLPGSKAGTSFLFLRKEKSGSLSILKFLYNLMKAQLKHIYSLYLTNKSSNALV